MPYAAYRDASSLKQARREVRKDIQALKEAHRDPADLPQRVAKFQLWLSRKRAGKLPMYERVGTLSPSAQGTASRSEEGR